MVFGLEMGISQRKIGHFFILLKQNRVFGFKTAFLRERLPKIMFPLSVKHSAEPQNPFYSTRRVQAMQIILSPVQSPKQSPIRWCE